MSERTDKEERAEMDRVAVDLGFKSAKDMAGALLDHELETTTDIERLRFWAQNLRKLGKYKTEKLELELAALEEKRREDVRKIAEAADHIYVDEAGRTFGQWVRAAFPEVFNES